MQNVLTLQLLFSFLWWEILRLLLAPRIFNKQDTDRSRVSLLLTTHTGTLQSVKILVPDRKLTVFLSVFYLVEQAVPSVFVWTLGFLPSPLSLWKCQAPLTLDPWTSKSPCRPATAGWTLESPSSFISSFMSSLTPSANRSLSLQERVLEQITSCHVCWWCESFSLHFCLKCREMEEKRFKQKWREIILLQ